MARDHPRLFCGLKREVVDGIRVVTKTLLLADRSDRGRELGVRGWFALSGRRFCSWRALPSLLSLRNRRRDSALTSIGWKAHSVSAQYVTCERVSDDRILSLILKVEQNTITPEKEGLSQQAH
jgi:hypothetical protein